MSEQCDIGAGVPAKPIWHRQIEAATTVDAVIWIVRDYLAHLTPGELARLPEHCRPDRVKTESDIHHWTLTLIELSCLDSPDIRDLKLLQQVSRTFALASLRISDIYKAMSRRAAS